MTKRIFRTIILVAGSVLAAAFVIIIGCLYGYFIEVQENLLCDELDLAAAGAEYGGVEYLNKLDCGNYRLTWISKEGTVLFDSEAKESDMENHANREEVAEALKNGTGKSSRYSETLLKKTIYYAKR
ncbi:MAG: two-component sensor histidine kinase, partial [Firmicutes bacterium]|nr:two-component sensor histidine kinase [Bacillota bacterium]